MVSAALCTAMIASYRKNIVFWTKFISGYKLFNENRREHLWSEVYPNLIFLSCKSLLHQENTNKQRVSLRGENFLTHCTDILMPGIFRDFFRLSFCYSVDTIFLFIVLPFLCPLSTSLAWLHLPLLFSSFPYTLFLLLPNLFPFIPFSLSHLSFLTSTLSSLFPCSSVHAKVFLSGIWISSVWYAQKILNYFNPINKTLKL